MRSALIWTGRFDRLFVPTAPEVVVLPPPKRACASAVMLTVWMPLVVANIAKLAELPRSAFNVLPAPVAVSVSPDWNVLVLLTIFAVKTALPAADVNVSRPVVSVIVYNSAKSLKVN